MAGGIRHLLSSHLRPTIRYPTYYHPTVLLTSCRVINIIPGLNILPNYQCFLPSQNNVSGHRTNLLLRKLGFKNCGGGGERGVLARLLLPIPMRLPTLSRCAIVFANTPTPLLPSFQFKGGHPNSGVSSIPTFRITLPCCIR